MADQTSDATLRDDAEVEFGRIVAFTDGVFSIAITLLVLGFDVPSPGGDLVDQLWDERHNLFAYALSFAVLGRLWIAHHGFFGGLASFDPRLVVLNLVYLAWIAIVPFSSQLLGDYGDSSPAVAVYAAVIALVLITFGAKIVYAYRRGLLREDYRETALTAAAPGTFAAALVFAASIPIAAIDASAGEITWVAVIFADPVGRVIARALLGDERG